MCVRCGTGTIASCDDPFKHTDGGWPTAPLSAENDGSVDRLERVKGAISHEYFALLPEDRPRFLSMLQQVIDGK